MTSSLLSEEDLSGDSLDPALGGWWVFFLFRVFWLPLDRELVDSCLRGVGSCPALPLPPPPFRSYVVATFSDPGFAGLFLCLHSFLFPVCLGSVGSAWDMDSPSQQVFF